MRSPVAFAVLVSLVALAAMTAGCMGTTTRKMCVDSVSSSGGSATISGQDGTFSYSDPGGLVNANWKGRGVYIIVVDNNVVSQTLKGFTNDGNCPIFS